jgi:hypothetical protein
MLPCQGKCRAFESRLPLKAERKIHEGFQRVYATPWETCCMECFSSKIVSRVQVLLPQSSAGKYPKVFSGSHIIETAPTNKGWGCFDSFACAMGDRTNCLQQRDRGASPLGELNSTKVITRG